MKYSLDTSALINSWRKFYPQDVFPSFWQALGGLIRNGVVRATEEVRQELEKQDDELLAWARPYPELFVPLDRRVQEAARTVLAGHARLIDTRKGRSGADPFVIALGLVEQVPVVTYEGPSGKLTKPRIPDVCEAMGIEWMTVPEFLRTEGIRF